jgi:hypothetical protein
MEQLEAMMRMTFDFWTFCARTPAAPECPRESHSQLAVMS